MRISDWSSDVCSSDLSATGTFLKSRQQLISGAPWTRLAATLFHPPHFRGRAGLTYGGDRYSFSAFVNHMSALDDDRQTVTSRISAYTTVDLRSEEHTSELQSLMRISYAVFCLKKKILKTTNI